MTEELHVEPHIGRWTEDDIRALGTRTDLKTACSIAGVGYTTGKAMARDGTLPFPVFRVGHKYIVPVAGLLRLLLIESGEHSRESGEHSRTEDEHVP